MHQSIDTAHVRRAIGERIRRTRARRGVTQRQLAAAIERTQGYVSQLEGGHLLPSRDALQSIALELDVSPAWLASGETDRAAAQRARDGSVRGVRGIGTARAAGNSVRPSE